MSAFTSKLQFLMGLAMHRNAGKDPKDTSRGDFRLC